MPRILIIRFSSIGDIVLTTPVIRAAKEQIKGAEVHFLTKKQFAPLLEANPNIDQLHTIERHIDEVKPQLKELSFDVVIDLHNNLRTGAVKRALGAPSHSFNKLNIEKWVMVNFKVNKLPNEHIVDRYLAALNEYHPIKHDGKGLDHFIPREEEVDASTLPEQFRKGYLAWVIGGSYFTKIFPAKKVVEVLRRIDLPVVLLGGKEDVEKGEGIRKKTGDKVFNACGDYSINQSASLVKQAEKVLTNDTGLMHIAAAFEKPILSFWGNTIPEFGMTPYYPAHPHLSTVLEIKDLKCRPCSKLGYKSKCPKGHFYCMELIDVDQVVEWIGGE